jgi:hypothetical protein
MRQALSAPCPLFPRPLITDIDRLGTKITRPIDRKELFRFKIQVQNPSAPLGKGLSLTMTKLLEHAVDSVRALPSEVQDELARLLLQVAGEEQPVIQLTAEERADLAEADAEIARGEFAMDEQIRSMLAKRTV